jgi:DDE superfamily endonuclease/helix-turn-helix, Psq domain
VKIRFSFSDHEAEQAGKKMVRNYKPKIKADNGMANAVNAVISGVSYRRAAAEFNVKAATLQYHVKKAQNTVARRQHETSRVFSELQESALVEHLMAAAKMYHGLTYLKARSLAHDYGVFLKRKMPVTWTQRKIAGIDWLQGFLKRHPILSLRKPQNTSLARAIAFNRVNTSLFFNNLLELRSLHHYLPDDILNLDETGLVTVMDSPKIIAQRGIHQVGQVVSAERGDLVTYTGIITASGRTIPPVFIFPRAKYKNHFLESGPPSSLGLATPSGWMTSENFVKLLEHIVKQKHCNVENRILLIMDNHESHCSIAAMEFCRENGIDVLTLPPHCSHKLQPLDVGLFGPFKNKLKVIMKNHLAIQPGKFYSLFAIKTL